MVIKFENRKKKQQQQQILYYWKCAPDFQEREIQIMFGGILFNRIQIFFLKKNDDTKAA